MGTRLSLRLLGPPEVRLGGEPVVGFRSDKVRALLFYLAVEADRPHRRESLAGLLWADYPERSARTNLSNTLSNLRTVLCDRQASPPCLLVSRETIQFNAESDHEVDATAFDRLVGGRGWEAAVGLYRGPFLEGFSVADSPPFEQWALVERERAQREMLSALEGSAAECEARGDYARAGELARRQLEIEAWHEGAHRALMRALALGGERASALAQYEACARTLRGELDVAPEEETARLYEAIRSGAFTARPAGAAQPAGQPEPAMPAALSAPAPATLPSATPASVSAPTAPATPVALSAERRLATALLAELGGATRLLDELGAQAWAEKMATVLEVLETEVHRFGGVVHERHEDGLVALFGVPLAHEDDPERAVLAALAMQEARRTSAELQLRVGVDTGEVFVTAAGEGWQAVGRAVPLARRAGVAAEPGTVLVGDNAYRLLRSVFEWGDVEGHAAWDMHRPLARAAVGDKGRGIAGLSSPLVGRDRELRSLQEAVERAWAGVGGIVTLVGEAGVGKSRLVAEARKARYADGKPELVWVGGRCLSYGGSIAYLPWVDLLRGLLGVKADDPPPAASAVLQARVEAWCAERAGDVYPFLCRLLSLPLGDEHEVVRDLQGENLKAQVLAAVEALIEGAARQAPLVLVCEDLHWADPTSLELLERLLALTDREAVLIVCVLRPEAEHGSWRVRETAARLYRHRHTDLWLEALSADESAALVGYLLQVEALPPALRAEVLGQGEGNPFYIEEIIRSLIDEGTIALDEGSGRWQAVQEVGAIHLPDTLLGVLAARIDRLPEGARRVLRLAAVIGRAFSYRVLAEALGADGGAARGALLQAHLLTLLQHELIRERARVPEAEYIFKHELTREAAYSGLPRRERSMAHRRVAEALERLYPERMEEAAGLLAQHWEGAEEPERAIEYLLKAGEQARVAYANEEAIAHFQRALSMLDAHGLNETHPDWRLSALRGSGVVLYGIGRVGEAEAPLREAIAIGKRTGLEAHALVRLYFWLGEVRYWQGYPADVAAIGEEGLALLGADDQSIESALMMAHLGFGLSTSLGDWARYREWSLRAAQFLRSLPYEAELRPLYDHIISTHVHYREPEAATHWCLVLEEQASAHRDLRGVAEAAMWRSRLREHAGDVRGKVPACRRGLDLYGQLGDALAQGFNWVLLGSGLTRLGDLDRAEEAIAQAVALAGSIRQVLHEASIIRGDIALCRRDWAGAKVAFADAERTAQELVASYWGTYSSCCLGLVALAQGDRIQAVDRFERAITLDMTRRLTEFPRLLAFRLGGLEMACQDPAAFRTFCHRYQEEHPEIQECSLAQWYLQPARAEDLSGLQDLTGLHCPGWLWHDPYDDCSYTLDDGLVIRAANGRDMWNVNWSAPRLMRQVPGDLVMQTVICPALDDRPGMGGLLLWTDRQNYLGLQWGTFGPRQVALEGAIDNVDVVIGRGLLPEGAQDRAFLRLERRGEQVTAFCSADGEAWFSVGRARFPAGPAQVGLYAIGSIARDFCPGAYYPEGTATRFERFELWEP